MLSDTKKLKLKSLEKTSWRDFFKPSLYTFDRSILTTACGLASRISDQPLQEKDPQSRKHPNILLIHADQHRWDSLGAYGNTEIKTPNLDALAADGVTYRNSFCTYPVCTPSRYSLLSGQYVWEHKGWTNHCTLAQDIPTFPRVLRDADYHTAAVGKMHFTPTYLDVGFDEMILCEQNGPGRWDDDYHRYLMEHNLVDYNDIQDQVDEYRQQAPLEYWDSFGAQPSNLPEEHHSTTWIGNRTVEQIDQWNNKENNLLMTGFVKPHHPFDPPQEWLDLYNPEDLTLPNGWTETVPERDETIHPGFFPNRDLTPEELQRVMAAYYATISHIDAQVGRMISLLKEKGIYDQTMIIYTSDHGEHLGHHHMLLKGGYMYDSLAKVPLIIKYPDSHKSGEIQDGQVTALDVARTVVEASGSAAPDEMHGSNLAVDDEGHEFVFAENHGGRESMVRTQSRKLLLDENMEPKLLFDLDKDPYELQNRLHDTDYEENIKRLLNAAEQWRSTEDIGDTYLNEDEQVIQQLNVPPGDLSHRPAMKKYYADKMSEMKW